MTAKYMIEHNKLERAIKQYENANKRWREHWWETIVIIYNNSAEWATKFVIEPINKMIYKIGEKAKYIADKIASISKKAKQTSPIKIDFDCGVTNTNASGTYVIEHWNGTERQWLKVGKTKHLLQRLREHLSEYKENIDKIIVKAFYPSENEEISLTMENVLRAYYKEVDKEGFKRNDRFINGQWTSEIQQRMNSKFAETVNLFA